MTNEVSLSEFSRSKGITEGKVIQMIRDGFYQGRLVDGQWWVNSSELIGVGATDSKDTGSEPQEGAFFSNLIQGRYGLAKTYWLYCVLVPFLVKVPISLIMSAFSDGGANSVALFAMLGILQILFVMYTAVVLVGVWRAAGYYNGNKVWAVLGLVVVVVGGISATISTGFMFKLLTQL